MTSLIDLIFYRAGLSELLSPFRTVQYTLLTNNEEAGIKRVVGLTPEASAYGPLCVTGASALLFLRPLYPAGGRRLAATAAFFLLVVMAFLSTSSTAIIGLAVLLSLFVIDLIYRTMSKSGKAGNRLRWDIQAAVLIVLGALVFGLAMPGKVAPVFEVLKDSTFNKTNSDPYIGRSLWTQIGWQAFLDTGGLGVGIGSIRTSNWAVNILGSTGLFGGLLMFGFLAQKLFPSTKERRLEARSFAHALKLALPPPLAMSLLSGTMPDIGMEMAVILGFLSCENASSSGEEHVAAAASPLAEGNWPM